jgi:hypothetical protein
VVLAVALVVALAAPMDQGPTASPTATIQALAGLARIRKPRCGDPSELTVNGGVRVPTHRRDDPTHQPL